MISKHAPCGGSCQDDIDHPLDFSERREGSLKNAVYEEEVCVSFELGGDLFSYGNERAGSDNTEALGS